MGSVIAPPKTLASFMVPKLLLKDRTLAFHNIHTGEFIKETFFANGRYVPEGLRRLNRFLRDWRTGEVHPIDVRLFDLVDKIKKKLGYTPHMDVICGYRSPRTNHLLCTRSQGVAKKSFHMQGCAIDLRFRGSNLLKAHQIACTLKSGGVGLYSKDRFIHVDVRAKPALWGH